MRSALVRKRLTVYLLLVFLVATPVLGFAAPNKIMAVPGTPVIFGDAAQGGVVWTLTGLVAGAGQYSARFDKDTIKTASGAMPYQWTWRCRFQAAAGVVAGDVVEWYVSTSADNTTSDGSLGATTAALATDKRKNLKLLGLTIVDQTSASVAMESSGDVQIFPRYFATAAWNATTQAFLASTSAHGCRFTPQNLEIQAHALPDYDRHPEPARVPQPVAA
jgi:hypothetical protein